VTVSKTPLPPIILLTCGDPAGIGPEVVFGAWSRPAAHAGARLRVVGDPALLGTLPPARRGGADCTITTIDPDDARPSVPGHVLVVASGGSAVPAATRPGAAGPPPAGTVGAAGGRLAAEAVQTAAALVRAGRAAALVTGPLHKEALHAAGYDVPGHTELLARACGLPDDAVSMMLWLPGPGADHARGGLGVVHATLHEPLRQALARLSTPLITAAGRRLDVVLHALLGRRPRIGVAALNPHAGEGGLFGDEEPRLVAPAVAALAAAGIDAHGPLPADTLFLRASRGEFDGVVALYHDQGHIPVKLLGMHRAVNITLGLPIVRTSVAHGTAFDIVGSGRADPTSMLAAIDAAVRLAAAGGPLTAAWAPTASHTPR
jgi:4-hydroxythreonine-4-phosphate dehydrogenase